MDTITRLHLRQESPAWSSKYQLNALLIRLRGSIGPRLSDLPVRGSSYDRQTDLSDESRSQVEFALTTRLKAASSNVPTNINRRSMIFFIYIVSTTLHRHSMFFRFTCAAGPISTLFASTFLGLKLTHCFQDHLGILTFSLFSSAE